MNKSLVLVSIILATSLAVTAQDYERRTGFNTLDNEHYKIKMVASYPSDGLLEALPKVDEGEKRVMILNTNSGQDLKKSCNILYKSSKTRYGNPCYMIK